MAAWAPSTDTVSAVQLLKVAAAAVGDARRTLPERRWRRSRLRLGDHQALDRPLNLPADQVHHRIDVDAPGHVPHEEHQSDHANEGEQDADAERQVRDKLPLFLGADAIRSTIKA